MDDSPEFDVVSVFSALVFGRSARVRIVVLAGYELRWLFGGVVALVDEDAADVTG